VWQARGRVGGRRVEVPDEDQTKVRRRRGQGSGQQLVGLQRLDLARDHVVALHFEVGVDEPVAHPVDGRVHRDEPALTDPVPERKVILEIAAVRGNVRSVAARQGNRRRVHVAAREDHVAVHDLQERGHTTDEERMPGNPSNDCTEKFSTLATASYPSPGADRPARWSRTHRRCSGHCTDNLRAPARPECT
jgi:hypothetical protein